MKRSVFFISDRTGITAEMLGQALLSQFDGVDFAETTLPFIDNEDTARDAVARINAAADHDGEPPLVFDTMVRPELRAIIRESRGVVLDLFQTFVPALESTLGVKCQYRIGKAHSAENVSQYETRIEAVNYALSNDDGAVTKYYEQADLILVGVSRSGKTPTSLYLAMQFGIRAANYPITEEDMDNHGLPKPLRSHKHKLFGLTIRPERLQQIRTERRANSRYASLDQCRMEVETVERLYQSESIPWLDTTSRSVEEIATKILAATGLKRHQF